MIQRTGLIATILSGIMFGTSIPAIKLGLDQAQIPPILFATLRFLVASALVVLLLRKQGWIDGPLLKSRPMWVIGRGNAVRRHADSRGRPPPRGSGAALVIGS